MNEPFERVRRLGMVMSLCVSVVLSGCGQVVAVKVANQDQNINASYVCSPSDKKEHTFDCESGLAFHQYDAEVAADKCAFGVANLHVETNWHGGVTRIQYVCSTPPVTDPPDESSTEAKP